jgi:hypothetical protein
MLSYLRAANNRLGFERVVISLLSGQQLGDDMSFGAFVNIGRSKQKHLQSIPLGFAPVKKRGL